MDLGMSEMIVIGIVALIFIGPRDLPEMFRQLGRMTAKMRGMAREFSRAMEQAANETGVKDVARDLNAIANPKATGLNAVKGAMDKFEKWDPIKNAAKPTTPTALAPKPLVPAPMPDTPPAAAKPAADKDEDSLLDFLADDEPEGDEASLLDALLEEPDPRPAPAPTAASAPAPAAPAAPVAPAAPPPAAAQHGPHTTALYEKRAAREAIIRESAEKLRALNAQPDTVVPSILPPPPPVAVEAPAEAPAKKPRKAAKAEETAEKPKTPRKSAKPAAEAAQDASPEGAEAKSPAKPKAPRKKKASEE